GPLFFDFLEESGKKWEDLIQKSLIKHYDSKKIGEFYPRVLIQGSLRENPSKAPGHLKLHVPEKKWYAKDKSLLSAALKPVARPILKALLSIKITGLENIPAKGPAI